jgi:hypothetical protein
MFTVCRIRIKGFTSESIKYKTGKKDYKRKRGRKAE